MAENFNWTRIQDMEPGQIYLHFSKDDEIPRFYGSFPSEDYNYHTLLGGLIFECPDLMEWEVQLTTVHSEPYKAPRDGDTSRPLTLQEQMDNTSWVWAAEFTLSKVPGAPAERITSP